MPSPKQRNTANAVFALVLVAASLAAFGVGFYFTYGATVNVNARTPGEAASPSPSAEEAASAPAPTPMAKPSPSPMADPAASMTIASTAPAPVSAPSKKEDFFGGEGRPAPVASPDDWSWSSPEPAGGNAPAAGSVFKVQVGTFATSEEAQRQVDDLGASGIKAIVVYDAGRYHAQLGAFSDRDRAMGVAEEVNRRGYSVTIRR